MTEEIVPLLGYLLAIAMTVIAFLTWRKSMSLHDLLVEAANRFELGRKHNQRLEQDLAKANDKLQITRENATRLERSLDDARGKLQNHGDITERQLKDKADEVHRLTAQVDHWREQVTVLTGQLAEADRQRQGASRQLSEMQANADERLRNVKEPLEARIEEWKSKYYAQERDKVKLAQDLEALQKTLKESDTEDVKTLKRRLQQIETLYVSMRGLREMADERNQNWERALRKLSTWIIEQSGKRSNISDAAPIGPLVGQALEHVGAKLVDDDEEPAVPLSLTADSPGASAAEL